MTIGGLGTLIGPILGCFAIQYLITSIGTQQMLDANLVLGIILLGFVLLMPAGVVPVAQQWIGKIPLPRRKPTPPAAQPRPESEPHAHAVAAERH